MSTTTKALQLQKCEWLRTLRDSSGEQAKDILATIIVKTTPQQTAVVRAFQAAFANPIPIRKHLAGQTYLIKLLEEQLVEAKDEGAGDATCTTGLGRQGRDSYNSEDLYNDEEEPLVDESDNESLTEAFKTPRPASSIAKSRKPTRSKAKKSEKKVRKHKRTETKVTASGSIEEHAGPDADDTVLPVKEKKGNKSARTRKKEAEVSNEQEDTGADDATPKTPKSANLIKNKGKTRRKSKKYSVEDLAMDEDPPQPGPSPQHFTDGSKRKPVAADNPETPARLTKKIKQGKQAADNNAQLPVRPRMHSATPGPSKIAQQVRSEPNSAVNDGPHSSVVPKVEESDGDLQMFSAPTTPFRQYRPMHIRSSESKPNSPLRRNSQMFIDLSPSRPTRAVDNPGSDHSAHTNQHRQHGVATNSQSHEFSPSARLPQHRAPAQNQTNRDSRPQAQLKPTTRDQPQRAGPAARQEPPNAANQPYRDPQGERQYKCRQCGVWFVYSENGHGACVAWHPGSALLITSRARNARRWTCCGRIGNGKPTQDGCVDQPHTWNGVDFTPREQPRRGQFDRGL
ncbi:hypothetical protein N0V93_007965 [Gnomoniopsis smithogilvyi]|uniref:Uncharacterized protein n=1 Tax=Gnomoniopsis smithogilvyi TaxID=1191159 RepID=A0A9W8YM32_9PEZI|nr:hypothetical protein N0V93_007965 [Gnomoniopsis smithogilvyi]